MQSYDVRILFLSMVWLCGERFVNGHICPEKIRENKKYTWALFCAVLFYPFRVIIQLLLFLFGYILLTEIIDCWGSVEGCGCYLYHTIKLIIRFILGFILIIIFSVFGTTIITFQYLLKSHEKYSWKTMFIPLIGILIQPIIIVSLVLSILSTELYSLWVLFMIIIGSRKKKKITINSSSDLKLLYLMP